MNRSASVDRRSIAGMAKTQNRAELGAAKKLDILDAAAQCFMLRGYNSATIDHIADLCSATKGLVYYHFRSKSDLFIGVYRRALRRSITRATPIAEAAGSGAEKLQKLCEAHILGMFKNLAYHHVTEQGIEFHLVNTLTPEQRAALRKLVKLRDQYQDIFVGVITEGIRDKTLDCDDVPLAARTILSSLNGVSMWYRPRQAQSQESKELLAKKIIALILRGVIRA